MELLNTHYYDGKCSPTDIPPSQYYTDEVFERSIREIREKMYLPDVSLSQAQRASVSRTLDLLNASKKNNFDSTDHLDSSFLLVKIWEKLNKEPAKDLYWFFEQLADIVDSGPCPQGRSKRLFSVYLCLYSTYKK